MDTVKSVFNSVISLFLPSRDADDVSSDSFLSKRYLGIAIGSTTIVAVTYFLWRRKKRQQRILMDENGITNKYQLLKLIGKTPVSHNTSCFRFALPSPTAMMGLPIGSHILLKNEHGISRPYTPITNDDNVNHRGFFDLMIKIYENGQMTQYLEHNVSVGDSKLYVRKYIGRLNYSEEGRFVIKKQVFENVRNVGMICGGTGITPILQLIRHMYDQTHLTMNVRLLYANRTPADILLRDEIQNICDNSDNIEVYFTVSRFENEEEEQSWQFGVGRVTKSMIGKYTFDEASDHTLMLMCGPKPFTQTVKECLLQLGHPLERVYCF